MKNQKTLLGFGRAFLISCLFFYPTTASIQESAYYLHWSPTNSLELFTAMILMSGLFWLVLALHAKFKNRITFIIQYGILALPLAFFAIHFFRQIMDEKAIEALSKSRTFQDILGILIVSSLFFFILKRDSKFRDMLDKIFLGLLTIALPVILLSFWNMSFYAIPKSYGGKVAIQKAGAMKENILILLFDETSYDYLYKNKNIRERFPNFKKFSEISRNYHQARSYGKETLTAIPPMLLGNAYADKILKPINGKLAFKHGEEWKIYDGNQNDIFKRAKALGLSTHLVGKYHPYCEIFTALDTCDTYSTYNTSGVSRSYNPLHAFLTNFNILPSKMPFGIFKNPVAVTQTRDSFYKIFKTGKEIVKTPEPFFAFVHFNIPHAPFVFNREGFVKIKDPFNQNEENYNMQLEYADARLGELLDDLKKLGKFDNTKVLVMSDHSYRKLTPEELHTHVPFLFKDVNQNSRSDIDKVTYVGDVVNCLLPNDPNCKKDKP